MKILEILAQSLPVTGPTDGGEPPPWYAAILANPLFLMVLLGVFMIWMMNRTKKQQERQRDLMLKELKRGDRVQTIGGMLGTVVEARDDEVLLKVDESSNTKIRFTRAAIHRVVEQDKSEASK